MVIEDCFASEIRTLLKQTIAQAEHFLEKQIQLLDQVAIEDCQSVINSFRIATTNLQSLIRFTTFKYHESAEEIDLYALIQEIIKQPEFSEIETQIDNLPSIHINRLRIRELFYCLLSNAAKSKATKVKITQSKNEFTFADNRPKMSKHDKEHLFHLLYSDKKNRTKSNIDLFIAKSILDFYESKIAIRSKAKMISFVFKIPAAF